MLTCKHTNNATGETHAALVFAQPQLLGTRKAAGQSRVHYSLTTSVSLHVGVARLLIHRPWRASEPQVTGVSCSSSLAVNSSTAHVGGKSVWWHWEAMAMVPLRNPRYRNQGCRLPAAAVVMQGKVSGETGDSANKFCFSRGHGARFPPLSVNGLRLSPAP